MAELVRTTALLLLFWSTGSAWMHVQVFTLLLVRVAIGLAETRSDHDIRSVHSLVCEQYALYVKTTTWPGVFESSLDSAARVIESPRLVL